MTNGRSKAHSVEVDNFLFLTTYLFGKYSFLDYNLLTLCRDLQRHTSPISYKIGRCLTGGNTSSIAKAIFAHSELWIQILLKLIDYIRDECARMCRRNVDSHPLFCQLPVNKLDTFSWHSCITELENMYITLLQLLTAVVSVNDDRNTSKKPHKHVSPMKHALIAVSW